MTTSLTTPTPSGPDAAATRLRPARLAAGWAAIAGTVPYLMLKALWLSGSTIGARKPAFLDDPSVVALNSVTVAMDLAVVVLALALTQRWGRRLPAWPILLPAWVGTGFLLPMVLAILPATVLTLLSTPGPAGGPDYPLERWVQPMVYGGFAWQGVFLLLAFVLYARDRWAAVVDRVAASPASTGPAAPLLRVVAGGGGAMAALSAGLHLLNGAFSGFMIIAGVEIVFAGLAVAGAVGVLMLVRGTARRRFATVAGWSGSAVIFSWGLWAAVTTMGSTALSTSGAPLAGMAQLTGLLGGFALAVAGLLALIGQPESCRPAIIGS